MSRIPRFSLWKTVVPTGWIAVFALCLLLPTGCSSGTKAEMPPLPPREHIQPGYTVTVEFLADGRWFNSGFEAHPNDLIIIEPLGEALSLPREALLVHIGRTLTQFVEAGKPQRVTHKGDIAFRIQPRMAGALQGKPVRVKISNVRKD